jgi:hypothetical protein
MIPVRAIELSSQHATALETEGQTHMDMDHSDQAFRATLCARSLRDLRA